MKYVIDIPEVKCCDNCPCHQPPEELVNGTWNEDIDSFWKCGITKEDSFERNKSFNCPLKPLKVKELEWQEQEEYEDYTQYPAYGINGIYIINCYPNGIYAGKMGFKSEKVNTLDEAKQFCQQHYENMILSELEV